MEETKSNGKGYGVVSLVTGILSLITIQFIILSIIFAVIAIVFGIIGRKKVIIIYLKQDYQLE